MEYIMMKQVSVAAIAAFAFTAAPAFAQDADGMAKSSEGVVNSAASCTYEGGTIMDLASGKVCWVPVRGEDFDTKQYDSQKLGVIRCSGNGAFANELVQPSGYYCRVYLEQKKVPATREEIEAETRAQMDTTDDTN
jgi:hypothetical protein